MTTPERLERNLSAILGDLAMGPTPEYLDDVFSQTGRMRQRPAWTFPERWFPMADITSRQALAPRVPFRAIGVALAILALLIAGAVFVGSHQHKLPPPFGLAANGLIAYANGGDIYTLDPTTGQTTAVVAGATEDTDPAFSPDGTSLAFLRTSASSSSPAKDLVVTRPDGSGALTITTAPIVGGPSIVEWSSDSTSLLVGAPDGSTIWLFDTTKATQPRVVATGADIYIRPYQPPNGSAILIRRLPDGHPTMIRLDLSTNRETVLATGDGADDLGGARWSPDGTAVLYNSAAAGDAGQRLFIVNADGTGRRQITAGPGTWTDIDAAWSPDGSRIAFVRYQRTTADDTSWEIRPIGVYSMADGSVVDLGPLPRDTRAKDPNPSDVTASAGEGFDFEWAPDGKSLIAVPGEAPAHPVVIDAQNGTWHNLAPIVQPASTKQAWQRLAP